SKLFVRKCYDDLLKIVIDDKTRDLHLSGNPGIGKTFFGYYLIYYLVKQGKTVIYDVKTLKGFVILFGQEEKQVAYLHRTKDAHIIRGYQSDPTVWYIVDGKVPDNCEASAKMVLICFPYKSHYSDFDKRHPDVRYMPVWSWDEINTCRTNIFTDISEGKVRELYLKWGGIPRYILEGATNLNTQKQLKKAIIKCNESILRFIGEDDANDEISHKIIHIWTNFPEEDNDNIDPQSVPYTETVIKFASDYVAHQVILSIKKKLIEEFTRNTDAILDGGESNPVLGCIFEQMAHRSLRNGGTFKRRSLDTKLEDNVDFQARELILFNQINEIQNGYYSRPLDKTFPSIDAIVAPSCLLQMTTAMNHPIKINGLKRVQSKLETGSDIYYYFVVSRQLYNKYTKQRYSTTDNE
ncbi:hypothetical protein C1645_665279, partial [Glomus cerebriforme]